LWGYREALRLRRNGEEKIAHSRLFEIIRRLESTGSGPAVTPGAVQPLIDVERIERLKTDLLKLAALEPQRRT